MAVRQGGVPRSLHSDPREAGRWLRLAAALLPDAVVLRRKRRNFARCARLGEDVLLSRDFSWEPHPGGEVRYEIADHATLRGCVLLARGAGRIRVGEGSVLNPRCRVEAHELVEIGAWVQVAHDVTILDTNSHDLDPGRRRGDLRRSLGLPAEGPPGTVATAPVRIGDDAWIGMHAILLKGVVVGEGAVVAAGSVVVSDVEPRTVVAGNPARPVKRL